MSFTCPTPDELEEAYANLAEVTEINAEVMRELVSTGVDLNRIIRQRAIAQAQLLSRPSEVGLAAELPDLIAPYALLSRAVRRNILLAQDLAEPHLAEPVKPATDQRARPAREATAPAGNRRETSGDEAERLERLEDETHGLRAPPKPLLAPGPVPEIADAPFTLKPVPQRWALPYNTPLKPSVAPSPHPPAPSG